jgi:MFS family permease
MYPELGVSIGAAGMIALVVTAGTIVSSLMSGTVLGRFGTGKVNFASTLLTGLALLGYALTPSYVWILVFAVPLGLGAGSVDAGLNSYVAMHYKAHHMNWLHGVSNHCHDPADPRGGAVPEPAPVGKGRQKAPVSPCPG